MEEFEGSEHAVRVIFVIYFLLRRYHHHAAPITASAEIANTPVFRPNPQEHNNNSDSARQKEEEPAKDST
jgi:hypothetical protein